MVKKKKTNKYYIHVSGKKQILCVWYFITKPIGGMKDLRDLGFMVWGVY